VGASASISAAVGFASTSVTVQPAPAALSISTVPPWRCTTVRTSNEADAVNLGVLRVIQFKR
jgi:hypothetical protein